MVRGVPTWGVVASPLVSARMQEPHAFGYSSLVSALFGCLMPVLTHRCRRLPGSQEFSATSTSRNFSTSEEVQSFGPTTL